MRLHTRRTFLRALSVLLTAGACASLPAAAAPAPQDLSLAVQGYVEAGMPPLDRPWTCDDLARAGNALASLASTDKTLLPKAGSERSGAVFTRLTRSESLATPDRSLPLGQRVQTALTCFEAANRVLKVYTGAFGAKAVGEHEMLAVMDAMLRMTVAALGPFDELAASLDPQDPTYATRMQGMAQWKRGIAGMIDGALLTVGEREVYGTGERILFVAALERTLPALVSHVTPEVRAATLKRLEAMRTDPDLKDVAAVLTKLHRTVMKALAAP